MVKTKHRIINNNFNFDVESYRNFKHKYEPSNICEMPVKWHKAKDFYVFDDNGNKWIDMTSGIFVTNAGHSNQFINKAIKDQIDKLKTPKIASINNIAKTLASKYSDLVGPVIKQNGIELQSSYTANLNGVTFLSENSFELQDGDHILIFSSQAGGQ